MRRGSLDWAQSEKEVIEEMVFSWVLLQTSLLTHLQASVERAFFFCTFADLNFLNVTLHLIGSDFVKLIYIKFSNYKTIFVILMV